MKFIRSLRRDDALNQQDERVCSVAKSIEHEELRMISREPDFVDCVIYEVHLGVQDWVGVFLTENVAFLKGVEGDALDIVFGCLPDSFLFWRL